MQATRHLAALACALLGSLALPAVHAQDAPTAASFFPSHPAKVRWLDIRLD